MTKQEMRDIAIRHQLLLERLKTGNVNSFNVYLRRWDKLIRSLMQKTGLDKLSEFGARKLEGFMRILQEQQGELFNAAVKGLTNDLPAIAKYEAKHEQRLMQANAAKAFRAKIGLPTAESIVAKVMHNPVQATGQLLDDFVDDWKRSSIARTASAVRLGYIQGKTVREIVKDLLGTGDLFLKDGKGAVTKRHAHTIVRTSIQHAASAGRIAMYEENEDLIQGYSWVSTLDDRTSSVCRSLDGQKFKLGQGPLPPIHPNCRSTTVPELGKEFDFLDEGAKRSAQFGPVNQKETYYAWLKRQDAEFQDSVLGASRGALFRNGGLTIEQFRALQLDKNFKPLTLAEMQKLEPAAFAKAGLVPDVASQASLLEFLQNKEKTSGLNLVQRRELRALEKEQGVLPILEKRSVVKEGVAAKATATKAEAATPADAAWNEVRDILSGASGKEEIHGLLKDFNQPKEKLGYFLGESSEAKELKKQTDVAVKFLDGITADKFKREFIVKSTPENALTSFYRHRENTVFIKPSDDRIATVVHEISHHIENVANKVDGGKTIERLEAFLEQRRGNEKLENLPGQLGEAKVFDDNWIDKGGSRYTSRTYKTGKDTFATEVIATGSERLWTNPAEFLRTDPEHFEVTVRTFLGLYD